MANYSVRRRNTVAMVTMSTLSLLLVFLRMTTLSSTAQAGRGGGVAGLFRFVDRKHELQQQRRDAAATDEDDFSSTVNINHHLHPLFQFPKDFNFSNNEISSDNVLCNEAVDFCSTGTAISEDDSITEDNDINNNNEFLSKLLASPSALQCRGGTSTISPTTSSSTMEVHTGRLDTAEKAKRHGKLEFSLFQNGDGSDKDSDGIPDRYMAMQLQRRPLAYQATRATLTWREKHEINSILSRPHPDFDVAKAVFPHYFVGRDVNGHVVFVQRPALLNLKLAAKNGLHQKALLGTSSAWLGIGGKAIVFDELSRFIAH